MYAFRLFLVAGWAAIAAVTVWAVANLGLPAAAQTFLADLRHPWRAQFYLDFELHLLLFAGWILWRERAAPLSFVGAAATMLLGALFTLLYLLFLTVRARGDVTQVLVGRHA